MKSKDEIRHNLLRDNIYNKPQRIELDPALVIGKSREYSLYKHNRLIGQVDVVFELIDRSILTEIKGSNSRNARTKGYAQCMTYLDWASHYGVAFSQPAEAWLVYPFGSIATNKRRMNSSINTIPLEVIVYDSNGNNERFNTEELKLLT